MSLESAYELALGVVPLEPTELSPRERREVQARLEGHEVTHLTVERELARLEAASVRLNGSDIGRQCRVTCARLAIKAKIFTTDEQP